MITSYYLTAINPPRVVSDTLHQLVYIHTLNDVCMCSYNNAIYKSGLQNNIFLLVSQLNIKVMMSV